MTALPDVIARGRVVTARPRARAEVSAPRRKVHPVAGLLAMSYVPVVAAGVLFMFVELNGLTLTGLLCLLVVSAVMIVLAGVEALRADRARAGE